ncbi:MAG TPA: type II toxin-antitoxin system VapC family toxin [Roseiarcus sp.]|jgi:predicted nucleic-acid-binding protein
MLAVDTNVVVRFLVKDDDAQAERARAVVVSGPVYVAPTVILECDWVLRSLYGFSASQVVRALEAFCGIETVTVGEAGAVRRAFRMADAGLDFADALHLSLSRGCEAFATFDKRFAQRAATAGVPPVKLI